MILHTIKSIREHVLRSRIFSVESRHVFNWENLFLEFVPICIPSSNEEGLMSHPPSTKFYQLKKFFFTSELGENVTCGGKKMYIIHYHRISHYHRIIHTGEKNHKQ